MPRWLWRHCSQCIRLGVQSPSKKTIDHAATIAIRATRSGRSLRSSIGSALDKLSYIWMLIMTASHSPTPEHNPSPTAVTAVTLSRVMLAAVRDGAGRRRVISARDTVAFPEPVVARAKCELRAFGPSLEFHLHLLASSPAEREATVADLAIVAS